MSSRWRSSPFARWKNCHILSFLAIVVFCPAVIAMHWFLIFLPPTPCTRQCPYTGASPLTLHDGIPIPMAKLWVMQGVEKFLFVVIKFLVIKFVGIRGAFMGLTEIIILCGFC